LGGDSGNEAHGGSRNDRLEGGDVENDLFGDKGDDTLTGQEGKADSFHCGPGTDTKTDFDAAERDAKTGDCENFWDRIAT
jgi:Ca2+-binding RTX toxin-like protein